MRNSSILTLVVAIILGLIAVAVMNKKMNGKAEVIPMVEVLVARQDLPRGVDITTDVVELKSIARDLVAEGTITNIDDSIDRMLLVPLAKGEMILHNRLGPKGENGLAVQIREGMRAFTIETPKLSSGVGGMIQPGNHVDVILTVTDVNRSNDSDFSGGGSSTILLQNVEVLAVDRRTDSPGTQTDVKKTTREVKDTKSVTLLVTPDQSALLTLGQTKGTLHLSLRHPNDAEYAESRPYTFREIQFMREGPKSLSERFRSAFASLLQQAPVKDNELTARTEPVESSETKEQREQPANVTKKQSRHNNFIRVVRGQQEETVIVRHLEQ